MSTARVDRERQIAGGVVPCSTRVSNLSTLLTRSARRLGDATALVWGDRRWSWRELEARVDAMATALVQEYGIAKGDRVLVQSANCNQMFESMFACFRVGAVWVPANYRQTPDEVAWLFAASGARGLICQGSFPGHAEACRQTETPPEFILRIGPGDFGSDYDATVERHLRQSLLPCPVERDDPCWFFYTSGTTGRPKAAVLTHGQMAFVITNHLCDLMPGTGPGDASLVVAPLSHGAGIHQLAQVAAGSITVLMPGERLDVPTAWALVERWRVSNMFTVPTIVNRLIGDPSVETADKSSLRHVIYAGAPMYREDQKRALAALGPVLVQYFGLGEVTGNITVFPAYEHRLEDSADAKIGTCRFPRTGMEVSIQDDEGRPLAPPQTGEICVCGPAVFAGYYNNPEANEKAFRDGWFRTGDLGHVDENGYVYITGRASDMYISGGSNVYPREIEEKILAHPGIAEAAVLGVPDPDWGEVGIAVCVASGDAPPDDAELAAFLAPKVARYKLPKRYIFLPELPKSAYGKITKKLIREHLEAAGLLDAPARF